MSGQARDSRWRAYARWRQQCAAIMVGDSGVYSALECIDLRLVAKSERVREHCERIVRLADEQAVFEDWTRLQGRGPELNPIRWMRRGRTVPQVRQIRGGWPWELARQWPGDSRAPMGRSLARVAQRMLDVLDGRCPWPTDREHDPGSDTVVLPRLVETPQRKARYASAKRRAMGRIRIIDQFSIDIERPGIGVTAQPGFGPGPGPLLPGMVVRRSVLASDD